ncbi:hypothetical protein [Sphingobacterium cellulitidis]|uniref:hypothetical protein n=1 Tax=Sphingobacterium cellulitidis TaxID=1768011 RepID=UPI000B93C411|nr:hypothetical protein CHT99_13415 [Sphingobacterium cellulitidis]
MGIRFEKDTILNWINEMGKYLRLVVDKYEAFDKENETMDLNQGYTDFFKIERKFLLEGNQSDIENFISSLEPEQVRPLAQLIMYDGLINQNKDLLQNAKFIFEWNMKKTGAYSFEDFDYLSKIDRNL